MLLVGGRRGLEEGTWRKGDRQKSELCSRRRNPETRAIINANGLLS